MDSKVIIYTSIFGDYDTLKNHKYPRELSFCFTDSSEIRSESWTIIFIKHDAKDIDQKIRLARYYKSNPHIILPAHDYSIWIDASLKLNDNMSGLLGSVFESDLATFKYPDIYGRRNCAYKEAEACIERGKDSKKVIENQMQRYKKEGYPNDFGLVETTIVIRKNTKKINHFNEFWWNEISIGSRRDQLSFNYSCWRSSVSYSTLIGYRLNNPYSVYSNHKVNVYLGHPY